MSESILELPASGTVATIIPFSINGFAESNVSFCSAATFRRHEGEKRRAYQERIREVERGSFIPLVFSSARGMGKAATLSNLSSSRVPS